MALDADEVVVANSGHAYIAPVATALPTDETVALNAAFKELGYFTENGVTLTIGRETADIGAWQARSSVRRIPTSEIMSFAFEPEQWNRDTVAAALGGGTWTEPTANHYKYVPASLDAGIAQYAFVLDFDDTAGTIRVLAPKVELAGDVTIPLRRDAAAAMPITFTVVETGTTDLFTLLTDMPQFEVA